MLAHYLGERALALNSYTLSLGNKIIPVADPENAKWRKAVEPVIQNFIDQTPNGKMYVDKIKELMSKP